MFSACGLLDVIHNIDMDIAKDDGSLRCARFPDDIAKNHTGFG